ncbi:hypothetical protein ACH5RR_006686 [Cinchona calisaya]|uniref:Uncharacterized protein n=1 Tax=Cinchona calisaya TaxID=153742 RepID=A0ABD3APQ5_9GENT
MEVNGIKGSFQIMKGLDMVDKVILTKQNAEMVYQLKPLFMQVETVSSSYNALLGKDWIRAAGCIPSSLHQMLLFPNRDEAKIVKADLKPFMAGVQGTERVYFVETSVHTRLFKTEWTRNFK